MLLNTEVTEIGFSEGLATGIIARKGKSQQISASGRCVIAASDLTALVTRLCPQGTFSPDYVKTIEERIPGRSCVMLFLGLDIDLRERGITAFHYARTWGEAATPELITEIAREGDYSKLPRAHVAIFSNVDPSCCPPGKSLIITMNLADPDLFERSLAPGRKRGKAYKELKRGLTTQLVNNAAKALDMPDLHTRRLELLTMNHLIARYAVSDDPALMFFLDEEQRKDPHGAIARHLGDVACKLLL